MIPEMLGDLQDQTDRVVLHLQGIQDQWQITLIKLHIHNGTNYTLDAATRALLLHRRVVETCRHISTLLDKLICILERIWVRVRRLEAALRVGKRRMLCIAVPVPTAPMC